MTAAELTGLALSSGAPLVVITGGEPAIYDLTELTQLLHLEGREVAIETSGAFPLRGIFDWVTVSPKWAKLPMVEVLRRANELKLIIDHPDAFNKWRDWLLGTVCVALPKHVWLHPEWSLRANASILNTITMAVRAHRDPYRAGWQIHKLYRSDTLDARSALPVPLGGNAQLGPST
jgi:7-carboxy-7-deazaguanine synthase